jgi:hypothetical protein
MSVLISTNIQNSLRRARPLNSTYFFRTPVYRAVWWYVGELQKLVRGPADGELVDQHPVEETQGQVVEGVQAVPARPAAGELGIGDMQGGVDEQAARPQHPVYLVDQGAQLGRGQRHTQQQVGVDRADRGRCRRQRIADVVQGRGHLVVQAVALGIDPQLIQRRLAEVGGVHAEPLTGEEQGIAPVPGAELEDVVDARGGEPGGGPAGRFGRVAAVQPWVGAVAALPVLPLGPAELHVRRMAAGGRAVLLGVVLLAPVVVPGFVLRCVPVLGLGVALGVAVDHPAPRGVTQADRGGSADPQQPTRSGCDAPHGYGVASRATFLRVSLPRCRGHTLSSPGPASYRGSGIGPATRPGETHRVGEPVKSSPLRPNTETTSMRRQALAGSP